MTEENIQHVIDLYARRETVDKESYLASYADIEKNDFNLNIPRYVDSSEEEEEIKLDELLAEMKETSAEIDKAQNEMISLLNQLCVDDADVKSSLEEFIKMMEGM